MKEKEYKLYLLAESTYIKEHKDKHEDLLFPPDWDKIDDYKLKTEIIAEAINKKCIIQYTELYKENIK